MYRCIAVQNWQLRFIAYSSSGCYDDKSNCE
jgi:hypothetical protein